LCVAPHGSATKETRREGKLNVSNEQSRRPDEAAKIESCGYFFSAARAICVPAVALLARLAARPSQARPPRQPSRLGNTALEQTLKAWRRGLASQPSPQRRSRAASACRFARLPHRAAAGSAATAARPGLTLACIPTRN